MGICEPSYLHSIALIGTRVLVERVGANTEVSCSDNGGHVVTGETTASGLIIPEHSTAPSTRAKIISVGSKCKQVRPGQVWTFCFGTLPVFEDGEFLILDESDLQLQIEHLELQEAG